MAQGAVCRVVRAALLNPSELRRREQTVTDKLYSFVVNFVVSRLCQLSKHVNDKQFYFVRVQKAEQDWTDKGDHFIRGDRGIELVHLIHQEQFSSKFQVQL